MDINKFARASHQYDLRRSGDSGTWEDLTPEQQEDYLIEAKLYLRLAPQERPLWVKRILEETT